MNEDYVCFFLCFLFALLNVYFSLFSSVQTKLAIFTGKGTGHMTQYITSADV